MASVFPKTTPRQRVNRYVSVRVDGKQKRIAIGKQNMSYSNVVAARVSELEDCLKHCQQPTAKLKSWLDEPETRDLRGKLVKAGLLNSRSEVAAITPAELVAWFLGIKAGDLNKSTLKGYRDRLRRLVKFLESEGIDNSNGVTSAHLERFKSAEIQATSRSTAQNAMSKVKVLFRDAASHGLVENNQALAVKSSTGSHRVDLLYIDTDWFADLLDCTKRVDLKTSLMLARYAGARVPSELIGMTWGDIDLDPFTGPTISLENVKTSRSRELYRTLPLYPPLHKYLCELFVSRFGEREFSTEGMTVRQQVAHHDSYPSETPVIESKGLRDRSQSYAAKMRFNGVWKRWDELWAKTQMKANPRINYSPKSGNTFMDGMGIKYRLGDPIPQLFRACRRSFANDLLTKMVPLQTAAYTLGHNVETMLKSYSEIQERHKTWLADNPDSNPFEP